MKKDQQFFVITCVDNDIPDEIEFLAVDHTSGGYYYWADTFFSAKRFISAEDAIKVLQTDSDFNKESVMTNGEIFPPRLVQNGAHICYTKLTGSVTLAVQLVYLGMTEMVIQRTGEIKTPKGYRY